VTHDPLCSLAPYWANVVEQGGRLPTNPDACPTCDLIAKVRADERRRAATKQLEDMR
jgi:hypothetical protein